MNPKEQIKNIEAQIKTNKEYILLVQELIKYLEINIIKIKIENEILDE